MPALSRDDQSARDRLLIVSGPGGEVAASIRLISVRVSGVSQTCRRSHSSNQSSRQRKHAELNKQRLWQPDEGNRHNRGEWPYLGKSWPKALSPNIPEPLPDMTEEAFQAVKNLPIEEAYWMIHRRALES